MVNQIPKSCHLSQIFQITIVDLRLRHCFYLLPYTTEERSATKYDIFEKELLWGRCEVVFFQLITQITKYLRQLQLCFQSCLLKVKVFTLGRLRITDSASVAVYAKKMLSMPRREKDRIRKYLSPASIACVLSGHFHTCHSLLQSHM